MRMGQVYQPNQSGMPQPAEPYEPMGGGGGYQAQPVSQPSTLQGMMTGGPGQMSPATGGYQMPTGGGYQPQQQSQSPFMDWFRKQHQGYPSWGHGGSWGGPQQEQPHPFPGWGGR